MRTVSGGVDVPLWCFLALCVLAALAAFDLSVREWARVWPLQTLVKAMGAYFVRRNSGDVEYRTVLQRYDRRHGIRRY